MAAAGRPRLVLAALGQAHLFVLEALSRGRFPAVRAVLVSPRDEYFILGDGLRRGCRLLRGRSNRN